MSGVRALRHPAGTILFFFSFYTVDCHHLPSHPTHPSAHLRRRPLNCGYVPRARRHTGIIVPSLRSHSNIPTSPRASIQSAGLCILPRWTTAAYRICLFTTPYIMFSCPTQPPPHIITSRSERLITVPPDDSPRPTSRSAIPIPFHDFLIDE